MAKKDNEKKWGMKNGNKQSLDFTSDQKIRME